MWPLMFQLKWKTKSEDDFKATVPSKKKISLHILRFMNLFLVSKAIEMT